MEPRSHFGTVAAEILSGCEMLRASPVSVCLCCVLWFCVAHVVRSNGLPEAAEANTFAEGFFPIKESAHSPQTHAQAL